ncbi:hypothetical protein J8281_16940 [Aquimarina sp. U1-2]|uniref:hypothetical protein n=1 Tax=Aquimarina sp. U1-2 TaxID=2823141 RepID=UPI001AEC9481|nr:hypothetical protein [Aquimarina sp. U1-2]MBP2833885.1 hypothetical protein [Aquimarina sp. U1-2]
MKPTVFIFFLIGSLCSGQKKIGPLSDISNKYKLIRELIASNALRQYHTDYSCDETSEQGSLTFYFNSRELKHILHTYKKGHVAFRDEYYVWNDELFFQYAIHDVTYKDYKRNTYGKRQLADVSLTLEERFYFKDQKVIKCQFKDYENRSDRSKKIKTNHVPNKSVGCDQATQALEKYKTLLQHSHLKIEDACNLPRSISNAASEIIAGEM